MNVFVVDASVGIKWFLPEIHSQAAIRLHNPAYQLHVPGLFDVEIGNILWKKIRRGEILANEATAVLEQLVKLPLVRHTDVAYVPSALDLATESQRTVYDCLYLALAIQLGGQFITADERLFNSMAGTVWESSIRFVENMPA